MKVHEKLYAAILLAAGIGLAGCSSNTAGPNRRPVAEAGPDVIKDVGTTVTLDGSKSFDPDGDKLTYQWSLLAAPTGSTPKLSGERGVTTEVTNMNVDRALMYVVEGGVLRLRRVAYHQRVPPAARNPLRVEIPLDPREGLTARSAVENQAFNVADPAKQEGINVELARRIGLNPFALSPMVHRGKVLGVLGIDRNLAAGVIGEDEFDVLKVFARQAGQTLWAAAVDSAVGGELASRS